jgi:hypothetical protein
MQNFKESISTFALYSFKFGLASNSGRYVSVLMLICGEMSRDN